MKTPTLIITGAVTGIGLMVASFFVAGALRPDDGGFPIDAPIEVPGSSIAQAQVLEPVAEGADALDLDSASLGPSTEVGTLAVTVPDADEAAEVPPSIVAAAAALDSAGGDIASLVDATEPSAPTDGDDASPASDPCAPSGEEPADTCPEGVTATVLSLTGGDFAVYAGADPVTGPGMGSSLWCEPGATEEGALRLGGLTSAPGTVTITYWPEDDPADVRSAELTAVASFEGGWTRHCGVTGPLDEGRYEGSAIAISADGVIAAPYPLSFDSRGRPTVPDMRVLPLGTNWLWVGVYHTVYETALIDGFPMIDGGDLTCADAGDPSVAGVRTEIAPHTSTVPGEWLERNNFNGAYTRVTSALLYLPEGSSAGICGNTYATGEPSWDRDVPERVQFTTVSAPDSWEAVVTLRDITVYQGGSVQLQALGHLGSYCGRGYADTFDIPRSDTATVFPVGEELCRISGQNVQLEVSTFFTPETGGSGQDESRARFALMGANCTGACPEPEPRTYTVFLPGLGQDQCPDRATDDCELRRRVAGARAVIDVTWERGGDSSRTEWGLGGVADAPPAAAATDGVQFDTGAAFTAELAPDGFSGRAHITLRWDREVDFSARLVGTCFNGTPGADAPAPVPGTSRPQSAGVYAADLTFRNLCPGHAYALVVTFTDDAGVTHVAAPEGLEGVTPDLFWWGGGVVMPQRFIEVKAAVEIIERDGIDASLLVRDSIVGVGYGRLTPSFGPYMSDRCFPGPSVGSDSDVERVELQRTYDIVPQINVFSDWYYYPNSPTCAWRASSRWVPEGNASVTLDQLLDGVVIEGVLVPYDLPPGSGEPPYTYRITLIATPAEDED